MKSMSPSRVIPEIWYNDFASHYISDKKLHDFIANVEIGVNTYDKEDLHLLYITLYVNREQFDWLKESETLRDMKVTINPLLAEVFPNYDFHFCLFLV